VPKSQDLIHHENVQIGAVIGDDNYWVFGDFGFVFLYKNQEKNAQYMTPKPKDIGTPFPGSFVDNKQCCDGVKGD